MQARWYPGTVFGRQRSLRISEDNVLVDGQRRPRSPGGIEGVFFWMEAISFKKREDRICLLIAENGNWYENRRGVRGPRREAGIGSSPLPLAARPAVISMLQGGHLVAMNYCYRIVYAGVSVSIRLAAHSGRLRAKKAIAAPVRTFLKICSLPARPGHERDQAWCWYGCCGSRAATKP